MSAYERELLKIAKEQFPADSESEVLRLALKNFARLYVKEEDIKELKKKHRIID